MRRALLMRSLKVKVERPLAALVIIDTLADIGGVALAGWAAAELWGPASLLAISGFFTLATLFLGDILPKTFGAVHWRRLWPWAAGILDTMVRLLCPLIWPSPGWSSAAASAGPTSATRRYWPPSAWAGGPGRSARWSTTSSATSSALEEIRAEGIMTPRTVIVAADGAQTIAEVKEQAKAWGFSRVPVYLGGLEEIMGYVLKSQVLAALAEGEGKPLASLVKRLRFVPPSANALDLLDSFLRRREHMVMVWSTSTAASWAC